MQCWHIPRALCECLFSDFDNLGEFSEDKSGELRTYQMPFLSNEAIFDFDGMAELHNLKEKQTFKLRKNVADIYNLGARKYGKSLVTLKLDISLSALYDEGLWGGFYSIDEKRLRGVLDPVKLAMEFHPIIKMWDFKCSYKPEIRFYGKKNHWLLQGVNMTLKGKSPGEQFYQLHVEKLWGDEVSFETEEIYKKRKEALSEKGAILRLAGMTDFTKHSPIGEVFCSLKNKKHIINLPQYVNPFWDEEEREDRIEAYGGENSIDFRVYVEGEIVEDGVCVEKGTKILMSDFSTKNIEDVKVGDEILSFSEHPPRRIVKSKVLDSRYNGIKEVLNIESKNNNLSVTPNHRVIAYKRKSYKWEEIQKCIDRNYSILSLNNRIKKEEDYWWGVLLGIIESDGTRIYDRNKSKYSIYITQSKNTEYIAIENVFRILNLKFFKYDLYKYNMFRYCLSRQHNSDIEKTLSLLFKNKDCSIGFISGFLLGDGWVDKKQKLFKVVIQNNNKKKELLEKILKQYDIRYFSYENKELNKKEYGFSKLEILPFLPKSKKTKLFSELIVGSYLWKLKAPVRVIDKKKTEVYDLITDSHTYIANGFCIHNSEFDMERVRLCYNTKARIKNFEIPKTRFTRFKDFIVVERPQNCDRIFINADIGESSGTEIIIHSEIGEFYKYLYNITLYNLIKDEQLEIFRYLIDILKANVVGIDCGDALGRTLADDLERLYAKENVVRYAGAEKINVGFEEDEKGNIILKSGKPIYKQEFMAEWSVRRLKHLLYNKRIKMPVDHKFDKQINKVISTKSGNRTIFKCLNANKEDHMFDAHKVFAIAQWLKKDFNQTKPMKQEWGSGVSSWSKKGK